jgi:hypothetical protein
MLLQSDKSSRNLKAEVRTVNLRVGFERGAIALVAIITE